MAGDKKIDTDTWFRWEGELTKADKKYKKGEIVVKGDGTKWQFLGSKNRAYYISKKEIRDLINNSVFCTTKQSYENHSGENSIIFPYQHGYVFETYYVFRCVLTLYNRKKNAAKRKYLACELGDVKIIPNVVAAREMALIKIGRYFGVKL